MTMPNGTVGVHSESTFDDFLEEEGYRDEVESAAINRILAWQLEQEMTRQKRFKRAMAAELKTSRSQLDRLLALRANIDETESAAIITEQGGQENHRERLVLEIRDVPPQRLRAKRIGLSRGGISPDKAIWARKG